MKAPGSAGGLLLTFSKAQENGTKSYVIGRNRAQTTVSATAANRGLSRVSGPVFPRVSDSIIMLRRSRVLFVDYPLHSARRDINRERCFSPKTIPAAIVIGWNIRPAIVV